MMRLWTLQSLPNRDLPQTLIEWLKGDAKRTARRFEFVASKRARVRQEKNAEALWRCRLAPTFDFHRKCRRL